MTPIEMETLGDHSRCSLPRYLQNDLTQIKTPSRNIFEWKRTLDTIDGMIRLDLPIPEMQNCASRLDPMPRFDFSTLPHRPCSLRASGRVSASRWNIIFSQSAGPPPCHPLGLRPALLGRPLLAVQHDKRTITCSPVLICPVSPICPPAGSAFGDCSGARICVR